MDELKTVMLSAIKGENVGDYSKQQTSEAIRKALIELNGGSNKLNIKNFYRGNALFALVEELIPAIISEGFKDDDAFVNNMVEYRDASNGDEMEFYVEGNSVVMVADAAAGIQGVRRQRIDNGQVVAPHTSIKAARVYEELGRLLAGKITFDQFVDAVAKAFKQTIILDAYKAFAAVTKDTLNLGEKYVVAGSADDNEAALLELIQHVEAATGKTARVYGTKVALSKIKTAVVSNEAKSDLYNMGYYGKFNGTELIAMRQAHIPGTDVFALDDSKLFVVAGDEKIVKVVTAGEGVLSEKEATDNNDLTKEYVYLQEFGVAVVCGSKFGVFTMS